MFFVSSSVLSFVRLALEASNREMYIDVIWDGMSLMDQPRVPPFASLGCLFYWYYYVAIDWFEFWTFQHELKVRRNVWRGRFLFPWISLFNYLFLFLVVMANGQRNNNIRRKKFHLRMSDPFDTPNVHRQFVIWWWGIKNLFFYLFINFFNDFILIIIRLLYATLIC